jgi:GNAT superfamily N-acetyltransferase
MGRAFEDYPLLRYVVPDDRRRLRVASALYGAVIRYCLFYGQVDAIADVDGAACWLPPERPFPTFLRMVRAGMLRLPFQFGWTGYSRLEAFDRVATRMHCQHAPGPHWYLWAIGVVPERQGQGVGSSLMRPVLARADADGLPCYLETHKQSNTVIYARNGFRIVSESSVPGHPGTIWGMLRSPGARPVAPA